MLLRDAAANRMAFLFSLIPATALVVVGYFVLYTSARVEGGLRPFGRYLAVWIFVVASVFLLGGLIASTVRLPGSMQGMMGMRHHMERMESLEEEQLKTLRELQQQD